MRKKQNGGWKLSDTDWFYFSFYNPSCFFMVRVYPSPILFYFYFFIRSKLVRVDPSWSDPDWRSELIRSDFCICLYLTLWVINFMISAGEIHFNRVIRSLESFASNILHCIFLHWIQPSKQNRMRKMIDSMLDMFHSKYLQINNKRVIDYKLVQHRAYTTVNHRFLSLCPWHITCTCSW